MQSLDVHRPEMPELQFVLMVAALCTSDLPSLNLSQELRQTIFDRCWALVSSDPPPTNPRERVLDLRTGTELTLEALATTIRELLTSAGLTVLTWEHPPSEPSRSSTPQAKPLIDRLQQLYPDLPPESTPPDAN